MGCALRLLRFIARKYEFRDSEERAALGAVVEATFPPLLDLFHVRSCRCCVCIPVFGGGWAAGSVRVRGVLHPDWQNNWSWQHSSCKRVTS